MIAKKKPKAAPTTTARELSKLKASILKIEAAAARLALLQMRPIDPALVAIRSSLDRIEVLTLKLSEQYSELLKRCAKQDEQISTLIRLGHRALERKPDIFAAAEERVRRQMATADRFRSVPIVTDAVR
jgi:hypothetical protein